MHRRSTCYVYSLSQNFRRSSRILPSLTTLLSSVTLLYYMSIDKILFLEICHFVISFKHLPAVTMSQLLPIKKMKQGMSYSRKEKTIILNVFKYFKIVFPELCITELVRRTANATGCSEKSVFQFRKEEASAEGFKQPSKTKIRRNININSRDVKYDHGVRQAIRSIIYDLRCRNVLPSLNTILKHVRANELIPNFSLMTLRRLMFDMGFYYEKEGNKSVLTEKGLQPKPVPVSSDTKQRPAPQHLSTSAPIHVPQPQNISMASAPPLQNNLYMNETPQGYMPNETHGGGYSHATFQPHNVPMLFNSRHVQHQPPDDVLKKNVGPPPAPHPPFWMHSHHIIRQ